MIGHILIYHFQYYLASLPTTTNNIFIIWGEKKLETGVIHIFSHNTIIKTMGLIVWYHENKWLDKTQTAIYFRYLIVKSPPKMFSELFLGPDFYYITNTFLLINCDKLPLELNLFSVLFKWNACWIFVLWRNVDVLILLRNGPQRWVWLPRKYQYCDLIQN